MMSEGFNPNPSLTVSVATVASSSDLFFFCLFLDFLRHGELPG
jgi:hypothetical protein